jgi:hypothetical protein
MRDLLRGYTGWMRALAFFAALLVISLGLCGLNFGAFSLFQRLGGILIWTGMLELVGMGVGAVGVVICLLGLFIQTATGRTKQK